MADNVPITAGAGTSIKTDQLAGGEHVQYTKLLDGTADSDAVIPGDATNGLKVNVTKEPVFSTPASGELSGNAAATQLPNVACTWGVILKAAYDNAGRVYLGGASVTKKDGTTDTTTGLELGAGESVFLPVSNLNVLYRICDNAGDDLTYLAL